MYSNTLHFSVSENRDTQARERPSQRVDSREDGIQQGIRMDGRGHAVVPQN
jgi:hypothetical protein